MVKETKESKEEHVKLKAMCAKGVVTSGGGSASKGAQNAHLVKTISVDDGDPGAMSPTTAGPSNGRTTGSSSRSSRHTPFATN